MRLDWSNARLSAVDAGELSDILSVIRTQQEDATIEITPDGALNVKSVSADRITMVTVNTHTGFFTGGFPEAPFGIYMDDWLEALKKFRGIAKISWIEGAAMVSCGDFSTALRLYPPESSMNMPKLKLENSALLDPELMKGMVSAMNSKSYAPWRFSLTNEGLTINAYTEIGLGPCLEIPADKMIMIDADKGAEASFNWKSWVAILKNVPSGETVNLEMEDDYPCRLTFGNDLWTGQWLCAPMIEEDS